MLKYRSVGLAAVSGLLITCAAVPGESRAPVWTGPVAYYAPEELLLQASMGADPSFAVIINLQERRADFGHVKAEVESCTPDEPYFCLRGGIAMRFAVPKQYSGEKTWELDGYTYRVLPAQSHPVLAGLDEATLRFYVDVPAPTIDEGAFRRYVFIWSEHSGLIGWASAVHGCSFSTAELMSLPAHDYRLACLDRSFVVARGRTGLFARQ